MSHTSEARSECVVDRFVHDAHRMTDSATATSRCSRSPAPIVWCRCRLLLLMPTPRDTLPLAVLVASTILGDTKGAATTVASPEAFSPSDTDGSGSPHSCGQKNEKLGMEATGRVWNATPLASPNENPEVEQDGAVSAMKAEKEDLQAKVGEQASSSDMPWQAMGPPVLKLTSLLRVASGMENEHELRSSLQRPVPWQWLQESCDCSECSCIHECSA
ncbi:unnamed protein product [Urochloa decumbens]|uniref:Uncharacterized protein n=1 Tax=Urochloa decumbens TaxID=240449 RepID=A0ABC9DSR0_9POAL